MAGWNDWVPGANMTLSQVLDAFKSATLGLDVKDKMYWSFFKIVEQAIKGGNSNFDVEMARGPFRDLQARLDAMDADTRNINVNWINKNLGKFDQTFMTDEFLQQMAGTAPINAVPKRDSVTIKQLAIAKVTSANIFDKNSAMAGALNSSGVVVANADFYTSDFTKVSPGDVVKTSHGMQSYALYNSSGTAVTVQLGAAVSEVTIPANIVSIKATFFHTNLNIFMMAIGSLPAIYEPYKRVIDDQYIDDVDGKKLTDNTVTREKLSFLVDGKNKFNPEEATKGYYIDPLDGKMMINAGYDTSGKVATSGGENIVVTTARFVAFFDGMGNVLSSDGLTLAGNPTNYTFVTPNLARSYQVSYVAGTPNYQIEKGTQLTGYEPYLNVLQGVGIRDVDIIREGDKVTRSVGKVANLSNGQQIQLPNNSVKKNKILSFSAKITSFNSIRLGHGETDYGASYVDITATEIRLFDMLASATPRAVLSHGLTISSFLDVAISVDKDSKATVRLMTNNGFYETPPQAWQGYNGRPFVKSAGSTLTNCELVWDTADYDNPIYLFGDSYAGLTVEDRWPNYIREWGFDNWLINGYPGQASVSSKGMLDFVLSKGNPKILIWALGMNDGDSESAVNATWLSIYNQVRNICSERGIEFIPCTIPSTPTINNNFKNAIVKSSGYRYVDFAQAVGADVSVSWYSGMLHADQVHPTVLGAKKLALRAIQDIPELARV